MYILWFLVVMMLLKIRKFNIFLQVTHLHFHIFNIVYRDQRLWIPSLLPKTYVSYREGMQIICVIRFIPELPIWYPFKLFLLTALCIEYVVRLACKVELIPPAPGQSCGFGISLRMDQIDDWIQQMPSDDKKEL
jgi:hypothetical protein